MRYFFSAAEVWGQPALCVKKYGNLIIVNRFIVYIKQNKHRFSIFFKFLA